MHAQKNVVCCRDDWPGLMQTGANLLSREFSQSRMHIYHQVMEMNAPYFELLRSSAHEYVHQHGLPHTYATPHVQPFCTTLVGFWALSWWWVCCAHECCPPIHIQVLGVHVSFVGKVVQSKKYHACAIVYQDRQGPFNRKGCQHSAGKEKKRHERTVQKH